MSFRSVLLLSSILAVRSLGAAAPGSPPRIALSDLEGRTVTLASFRGASPVLVVFYRGYW